MRVRLFSTTAQKNISLLLLLLLHSLCACSCIAALEALPPSGCMPLPPHVQARIDANIEQHTALRSTVIAQQRKELCWWEACSQRV